MQRAGLGDDEAASRQLDALSPRQWAKLQPTMPERMGKMLEECGPWATRGGPYSCQRFRGAPGPMRALTFRSSRLRPRMDGMGP